MIYLLYVLAVSIFVIYSDKEESYWSESESKLELIKYLWNDAVKYKLIPVLPVLIVLSTFPKTLCWSLSGVIDDLWLEAIEHWNSTN